MREARFFKRMQSHHRGVKVVAVVCGTASVKTFTLKRRFKRLAPVAPTFAFGLLVKMAIEENCRRLVVSGCRDIEEKGRRTSRFGQHLEDGIRKKALSPLCRLAASLPQKTIDLPIDIKILGFARDSNIVLKFGKRLALPGVLHGFLNRLSVFVIQFDGCFDHLYSALVLVLPFVTSPSACSFDSSTIFQAEIC